MADLITPVYCSSVVPGSANVSSQTLAVIISAVSNSIVRYCRREFIPARFVELYDAPHYDFLMLRQTPVLALNSITLFPVGPAPVVCTADQFELRPQVGRISLKPQSAGILNMPFPRECGFSRLNAVEVDYTAGFGFITTMISPISAGVQTVTPAGITGVGLNNQPWAITANALLVIDPGTPLQETVTVSSVAAETFIAAFTQPHAAETVICGVMIPDDIAFAAALAVGNVLNQSDLTKQRESQGKTIGYEYLARTGDLIFTSEICNILNRYRDSIV